jgi:hypothetical protein
MGPWTCSIACFCFGLGVKVFATKCHSEESLLALCEKKAKQAIGKAGEVVEKWEVALGLWPLALGHSILRLTVAIRVVSALDGIPSETKAMISKPSSS